MSMGFVYEFTNKITGKKYIGSHIGEETDNYLGSGVDFLIDLKEYGTINYTRKILEYIENQEDVAFAEEKWLLKVDAKHNPLYLNKSNHAAGSRTIKKNPTVRPICPKCNQSPRAIAYHRNEKVYYRSTCIRCQKRSVNKPAPKMRWQLDGYKKKPACDRCGFRARFSAQLVVYHLDGNLINTVPRNLKTICQNCVIEVAKSDLPWRPGDLEPDR